MTLELDHVFICVEDPDMAERLLSESGLQFARRAVHKGQGTANVCAFFDNAYLELLWRYDDDELKSEPVRPVSLWERTRSRETGASPFGIAFRAGQAKLPIDTWPYRAPFLPAGTVIPVLTPRFLMQEPLIFLSLVSQAPLTWPVEGRPPLKHWGRNHRLTGVAVYGPGWSEPSVGLRYLCDQNLLSLETAEETRLELVLDGGKSGEVCDLRPSIPLRVRC